MRIPRAAPTALVALALAAGACGGDPPHTAPPTEAAPAVATPTPPATEPPFVAAAFPVDGSACDREGYAGRLGRIEAVDERTVRFTLCAPDGAFLARVAHPSLGIVDTTSIAAIAADPDAARSVAGTGPYRIDRWVEGDNVVLRLDGRPTDTAKAPVVVVRWDADPAARTAQLTDAAVDGIDAPGPAELDEIATLPELVVTPRTELATAFLAFGSGPAFAGTAVRRAIASAIDRDALATAAFPAGSTVPSHLTPCVVEHACGGRGWYEFNGPAATSALAAAGFDRTRTYPLHVPDAPVPGLPDPAGVAEALAAQLSENVGLKVKADPMPVAAFRTAADGGRLDGLYLDGIATSLADASGFLEPLFGDDARSTPARRATSVQEAVADASTTADPAAREAAITRANGAIRTTAVIVPLAHPGSVVAYRADVSGVVTSPLGLDPLGAATPGDRPQLVFMQASEPSGAWCGSQSTLDAYRVCGLVTEGLYGFAPGGLEPLPRLAACEPDSHATVWTCRLRGGRTFSDGKRVDAADVLETFAAMWDASGALRATAPDGAFAAWDELFGAPLDAAG